MVLKNFAFPCLLILAIGWWSHIESTQAQSPEETANEISNTVMSPYCPGRLLRDCPSSQATELKDKIKESLIAGLSEQQVRDNLYSEYGDIILSVPKPTILGRVVWVAPIVFLLLGGLLIFRWIRSNLNAAP